MQRWLQPGGHADGDGNLARVALREAEEETGIEGLRVLTPAIDLDVHVFHNAADAEPDHLHLDVRHLVVAPPGAVARGNEESEALRWVAVGRRSRRWTSTPARCGWCGAALAALDELDRAQAQTSIGVPQAGMWLSAAKASMYSVTCSRSFAVT